MATLIYALNSGGRGHTFRALAMTQTLRQGGHEVVLCCGGAAKVFFEERGERIIEVPALEQVIRANRGSFGGTIFRNARPFLFGFNVVRLVDTLQALKPDLLISDFEPFATLAAELMGLRVLALNRQQVVTETRYTLPRRYQLSAALTRAAVRYIAPKNAEHILLPTFSPLRLKHPARGTLIAPIVRDAVARQTPTQGDAILVYYNHTGIDGLLETLGNVKHNFVVYSSSPARSSYPNIQLKHPATGTFETDLARCKGVICTAGFTLMSEALYLGKPLLVHPNHRFFEQTLNALLLTQADLGHACFGRTLGAADIETFITALPRFKPRPFEPGNAAAASVIDAFLYSHQPKAWVRPAPNPSDRDSLDRDPLNRDSGPKGTSSV